MADTNSDLIAAQVAGYTNPSAGLVNGDDAGGLLLVITPTVTLPSGVAANDTFQLCDEPPGFVFVPELSSVVADGDPGTTLTWDFGYADNPDAYCDGINLGGLSAAGIIQVMSGTMPAAAFTTNRGTTERRIYATAATAGTVTAGVKLKHILVFRAKL